MGLARLDCGIVAGAKLAGAGLAATIGRPNWGLTGNVGLTIGCLCWGGCCWTGVRGGGGAWTNCLGGAWAVLGLLPIKAGRNCSSVGRGTAGADGLNATGLVCSLF